MNKKELFKQKSAQITSIHNTPKATSLGVFNDVEKVKSSIRIIPELKAFIRPLTEEQSVQLEQNIIKHGCQDALILWETTEADAGVGESEQTIYVLVDGHNRFEICKRNKLDFKISLKTFETLQNVKDYMIDLQIGRRNLTLEQEAYYRGLKYNSMKGSRGEVLKNQVAGKEVEVKNVAEDLADKFNVSVRTVKNDGKFAEGLMKLSTDLRSDVLNGTVKLSKKEIIELADSENRDLTREQFEELRKKSMNEKSSQFDLLQSDIKKMSLNLKTKQDCKNLVKKVEEISKLMI